MIKSLVTGGAGFIGSNLVDQLVKKKHKVIVLDNFSTGKRSNLANHKKKNVKIIKIDISNNKNLDKYFEGVNYVFHLAGVADMMPSIRKPEKYFKSNVVGTFNVVQAVKKVNINKFVYNRIASMQRYFNHIFSCKTLGCLKISYNSLIQKIIVNRVVKPGKSSKPVFRDFVSKTAV